MLTLERRIEKLWRQGWDVCRILGSEAGELLKTRFDYFPSQGTGIGIQWEFRDSIFRITAVHSSGPSQGILRVGDLILAVEGETPRNPAELEDLLLGPPGSSCRIEVLPRGAPETTHAVLVVQVPREPFTPLTLERWRRRAERWDGLS
mmetsp:Transcript_11928/g.33110  ORF Transcript_11928/g.33110 Transcript_11928/m.33110 type:complete len:148 (-) Transcript_11928:48-491(-)